jgi:MFS family permease
MTATQNETPEVLGHLDRRAPTSFYWSLTLLATVGGFLFGYDTANIGSVLKFLPYELTPLVEGYLVAGASIGAAVGALAAGRLSDRFGRKSLLIIDAAIYAVGALLSAFAWDLDPRHRRHPRAARGGTACPDAGIATLADASGPVR